MPANDYSEYDPMPSEDLLDEVAQSIAGVDYKQLAPDHRAVVFGLALQAEIGASLHHAAQWFKHSKLWEGV